MHDHLRPHNPTKPEPSHRLCGPLVDQPHLVGGGNGPVPARFAYHRGPGSATGQATGACPYMPNLPWFLARTPLA